MLRSIPRRSALAMALVMAASPNAVGAQEVAVGPATWAVRLHHMNVHPHSPRAARVTLDRLGAAAMSVCGASSFSLREVQASVRASTCWREAMRDVLARIGDPLLDATYRSGSGRHHGTKKGS